MAGMTTLHIVIGHNSLTGNRKRKVLKCLHAVCVACLSCCITYNGIVRCPNCKEETPAPLKSAISQFDALADCVVDEEEVRESNAAEAGVATCKDTCCDECFEERRAESKCVDCGAHFCPDHASVHPKSRAFYKHRLVQNNQVQHVIHLLHHLILCIVHSIQQRSWNPIVHAAEICYVTRACPLTTRIMKNTSVL